MRPGLLVMLSIQMTVSHPHAPTNDRLLPLFESRQVLSFGETRQDQLIQLTQNTENDLLHSLGLVVWPSR
jgi:hypothetical protein